MTQHTAKPQPSAKPAGKPSYVLRYVVVCGLALFVFGALFGMQAFGKKAMNDYMDNAPIPPATISAGAVRTMTWGSSLEAIGTLVAVNGSDLTTEAGGIVTEIHFESGSEVAAGTLLVTLDSANEAGELKRLEAQARLADLNLKRRQRLLGLEAIARSDLDAAVAEAAAARAAADAQRAKLAQKNIRAPFAGTLGIRQVNVGQFVAPGTPIVTLQALDPIDVDFSLPEQQIAKVQPGLTVSVKIEAFGDKVFTGEVLAVEPKIDEATRNFRVRARMANPDRQLRPGQFGSVSLALPGERSVLVVPRTAISYSSFGNAVFIVQKKAGAAAAPAPAGEPQPGAPPATDLEVVQRFVKTGEARGDFVTVVEGLTEGEQVATSGLLKLRNQQPVIIDNSVQPEPELNPAPANS